MQISIILPTRNEETLIESTLKDIISYLKKHKIDSFEILVVINGCIDASENLIDKISSKDKRIKILHSPPGYGFAMKKGLKEAMGNYVFVFNVDFYDLKMINLALIDLYGKDLIIGSKMTYWSKDKRPISRRIISTLFNIYLRLFFGFKGSDTHGIKVFRKEVVKQILLKCKINSGIFDTEFVLRSQYAGFAFADFPVIVEEKRPPRFTQRLLQTPLDLYYLHKSIKNVKKL